MSTGAGTTPAGTTPPGTGALGRPARELTDDELEQQGTHAHATRTWVFLHGTAEQYRHHTERMLELEQEYLRRHPKRTWQGAAGDAPAEAMDDVTRLRTALRGIQRTVEVLLAETVPEPDPQSAGTLGDREAALLARLSAAPGGRLHKLETHQAAREAALDAVSLARLYRTDPPLLTTDGEDRVLTDAGRQWLREWEA